MPLGLQHSSVGTHALPPVNQRVSPWEGETDPDLPRCPLEESVTRRDGEQWSVWLHCAFVSVTGLACRDVSRVGSCGVIASGPSD